MTLVFLGLTFALSAVFWWLIIAAGTLGAHGGLYVIALMWCPGVSALLTRLAFQHNVRGQGVVWLAGLGDVDLARFQTGVVPFVIFGSIHSLAVVIGITAWIFWRRRDA